MASLVIAHPRRYLPPMSPFADDEGQALDPDQAQQRCVHELGQPHPDYQAAQVYATLSLDATLREVVTQLAHLTKAVVTASRRR